MAYEFVVNGQMLCEVVDDLNFIQKHSGEISPEEVTLTRNSEDVIHGMRLVLRKLGFRMRKIDGVWVMEPK